MMKDSASPRLSAMAAMAVAVVLWFGGNHRADRRGGPDMRTVPAKPLNMDAIFIVLIMKAYTSKHTD